MSTSKAFVAFVRNYREGRKRNGDFFQKVISPNKSWEPTPADKDS